MKAVEIRELSSDDLTVKLKEARAELFNLARRARMREAAPVAAEPAASPLDFL